MIYDRSEASWLERRAANIANARGWPLPVARSEAEAELIRSRASGRTAQIVPILAVRSRESGAFSAPEGNGSPAG